MRSSHCLRGPAFLALLTVLLFHSVALFAQASESIDIRLQQAQFDPLHEVPRIPQELTIDAPQRAQNNYFLVQFHGPIRTEWRSQIESMGATVMDYVPDFAYIVRMDSRGVENARAIAGMRWIGIYEPGFRLSSELMGHALFSSPDAMLSP